MSYWYWGMSGNDPIAPGSCRTQFRGGRDRVVSVRCHSAYSLHYPFWSQGRLDAVKRVDLFARTAKNNVDISENADGTGKKDTLAKDNSLGDLLAGKLTKISLPAPLGKFSLHLNDNSMEDLWLALAWGK